MSQIGNRDNENYRTQDFQDGGGGSLKGGTTYYEVYEGLSLSIIMRANVYLVLCVLTRITLQHFYRYGVHA